MTQQENAIAIKQYKKLTRRDAFEDASDNDWECERFRSYWNKHGVLHPKVKSKLEEVLRE